MDQELYKKLERLAYERTKPFCYSCCEEAPSGTCERCDSDDLMRLLPGFGREYGVDWVIEEILRDELEPVDLEAAFEEFVRECYPEDVKVGWMTFDAVSLMKENDPISWDCARSDFESNEASDGTIVTLGNGSTYYRVCEIEELVS